MPAPGLAVAITLLASATPSPPAASSADIARWQRQAAAVTITRDDWGIAHVHGKTDADAVFGMEYAQAEDDFPRVEMNYVKALGRRAEADGESAMFEDLRWFGFAWSEGPDLGGPHAPYAQSARMAEYGALESMPKMEGRRMLAMFSPKKKK